MNPLFYYLYKITNLINNKIYMYSTRKYKKFNVEEYIEKLNIENKAKKYEL